MYKKLSSFLYVFVFIYLFLQITSAGYVSNEQYFLRHPFLDNCLWFFNLNAASKFDSF